MFRFSLAKLHRRVARYPLKRKREILLWRILVSTLYVVVITDTRAESANIKETN